MKLLANRFAGARVCRAAPTAVAVAGYAGALVFAGILLFAVIAGFTWRKYHADYAIYANMLWNSAHGSPFRYFADMSYLQVHLSFSLLALAPLFLLFDHPFLLAAVQWVCVVLGALVIGRAAVRMNLPHSLAAALVFFLIGYRFTQNVLVHAFHGVSLYFLLVPLLYYCLSFHKKAALLPWLLILGLREDGGLVAVPFLLYFAARDRWRAGYVLAALSISYVLLAVFAIYPAINDVPIFAHRHREFSTLAEPSKDVAGLVWARRQGLLLVAAPLLAMAGRQMPAALFLASAPLCQNLLSNWRNQYVLETHYAAAVMACLAVGLLESAARYRRGIRKPPETSGILALRAAALVAITLTVHFRHGVIQGSPKPDHRLLSIERRGLDALRVARDTPKDGVLLCVGNSEEYFAHRRDLRVLKKGRVGEEPFDFVFLTTDEGGYLKSGRLREELDAGKLGVRVFDGYNVLLERGADSSRNALLSEFL